MEALLWRSLGVLVAAITSLFSVKVFLAAEPQDAAGAISMVGWLAFLPLLQWGYGRPAYSLIRSDFALGRTKQAPLSAFFLRFAVFSIFAVFLFAVFGPWIAIRQGHGGTFWSLALFSAGLAALGTGTFQRDICYAVSRELVYERWEFIRKLVLFSCYCLFSNQWSMSILGIVMLLFALISQVAIAQSISNKGSELRVINERDLGKNALRYLIFGLNEAIFYSLPLIAFTFLKAPFELIYFGVWSRLFQFSVLPMRMLVDTRVNRQITAYHQGDADLTQRELRISCWLALFSISLMLGAIYNLMPTLLGWLEASWLSADHWFFPSLVIWSVGNAFQHSYGSFVLSYGSGFGFALKASLMTTIVNGALFSILISTGAGVGVCLVATGITYCAFTFTYMRHTKKTSLQRESIR